MTSPRIMPVLALMTVAYLVGAGCTHQDSSGTPAKQKFTSAAQQQKMNAQKSLRSVEADTKLPPQVKAHALEALRRQAEEPPVQGR